MVLTIEEIREVFKGNNPMLEIINKLNEELNPEEQKEEATEDNETIVVPIVETIDSVIAGALTDMDENPHQLSPVDLLQLMKLKREWQNTNNCREA